MYIQIPIAPLNHNTRLPYAFLYASPLASAFSTTSATSSSSVHAPCLHSSFIGTRHHIGRAINVQPPPVSRQCLRRMVPSTTVHISPPPSRPSPSKECRARTRQFVSNVTGLSGAPIQGVTSQCAKLNYSSSVCRYVAAATQIDVMSATKTSVASPRFSYTTSVPLPKVKSTTKTIRKPGFHFPRLATKEDPLWFHKLSSLTFAFSSAGIILMFPERAIFLHIFHLPGPATMSHLLSIWAPSCTFQAVTGARMAFQFRKRDKKSRDVFVNNSIMTLLNVWVVIKLCMTLAPPFNTDLFDHALITFFTVSVTYMTAKSVYHAPELLLARNKKKKAVSPSDGEDVMSFNDRFAWCLDYFNYIMPFFYPMPFIFGTFLFFFGHDSHWISAQCEAFPLVQAVAFYANVAAAFVIGMISLLVTLRDRKMVSKNVEAYGISVLSVLLTIFLFETLRTLIGFEVVSTIVPPFLSSISLDILYNLF